MAESRTDPIWHDRLRQPPRSAKAARVQDLLKRFEASQWRDPEDIAAAQFKQLSQVVSHAKRTIPHYAKTLGHVGSTDAKSLQSGRWLDLPVLERETVNQLGDGLLSRDVPSRTVASIRLTRRAPRAGRFARSGPVTPSTIGAPSPPVTTFGTTGILRAPWRRSGPSTSKRKSKSRFIRRARAMWPGGPRMALSGPGRALHSTSTRRSRTWPSGLPGSARTICSACRTSSDA